MSRSALNRTNGIMRSPHEDSSYDRFTDKGNETGMMEKLRWMHPPRSVYPHNEEAAPDLSYSNTIFAHSLLLWVCVCSAFFETSLLFSSLRGAN